MKLPAHATRWLLAVTLVGGVVGAGVSALGAEDDDIAAADDLSLRPSPDRGREQVMRLLARKEKALEEREANLANERAELKALEEQLQRRAAELEELRGAIRTQLVELDEDREARITHLVKMFESMRPKQAAEILEVTEDAVALEVLERMNRAKAGKTLANMTPDRAAYLAERIGDAALTVELQ